MQEALSDYLGNELCGPIRAECLRVKRGRYSMSDRKWYSRPSPVISWLCEGRVRTEFDVEPRRSLIRVAGDIVCYPPSSRHRLGEILEGCGRFLAVFVSFETASGADPLSFFDVPTLISRDEPAAGEIRDAITRLVDLNDARGGRPISGEAASLRDVVTALEQREMASRILRALLTASRSKPQGPAYADNTRIAPAVEYIRHHFRSPIRIETLARLTHLSRAQFHVCFRAATGRTPGEFIQRSRLLEAERFLVQTDLTIAEISERAGFSDPFHLSRIFRKMYGVPPRVYRKKHSLSNPVS